MLSAPFYLLFGVSHATAVLLVFLHYAAQAWGSYRLAGLWLPRTLALLCAATVAALPKVAFWGRQVMLEIPAFAFLVWSAYAFVRHLRGAPARWLYLACALRVLGMYTKISVVFMVHVYALMLFARKGFSTLRDRHAGQRDWPAAPDGADAPVRAGQHAVGERCRRRGGIARLAGCGT